MATLPPDSLTDLVRREVDQRRIAYGRVGGMDAPPPKASGPETRPAAPPPILRGDEQETAKRLSRRGKAPAPKPLGSDLLGLEKHFASMLRQLFADRVFLPKPKAVMKPGTIYTVNRVRRSRYVGYFCVSHVGHDISIAQFMFLPRYAKADIMLTVDIEVIKQFATSKMFKALNPKAVVFELARWKTKLSHLDLEGIGYSAELFKKLVDAGVLRIPRP